MSDTGNEKLVIGCNFLENLKISSSKKHDSADSNFFLILGSLKTYTCLAYLLLLRIYYSQFAYLRFFLMPKWQ